MSTAAGMRARSRASCWRRRRWRRRRAWTSAPTPPSTTYASPTRETWTTSRKRLDGLPGFARLEAQGLEAGLLGEHLVRVLRGGIVERAGVHLQRGLQVAETPVILPQDLGANQDVDLGLEQGLLAAVVGELLRVVLGDHLHEALRAHHAL